MKRMPVKLIAIITAVVVVMLLALVGLRLRLVAGSPAQTAAAQETPAPASPSQDEITASQLRSALENPDLSPEARKSLEEKLALVERLQEQRQSQPEVTTSSGEKGKGGPPIPNAQALGEPQQAAQDEIIEGSEGLVRTWEASITNLWQGERNGVYYQVLAGATASDANQGLVIVIATDRSDLSTSQKTILAPGKTGALRIREMKGTQLTLTGRNNTVLKFDVLTAAFIP